VNSGLGESKSEIEVVSGRRGDHAVVDTDRQQFVEAAHHRG
jgi:hypothetical protein